MNPTKAGQIRYFWFVFFCLISIIGRGQSDQTDSIVNTIISLSASEQIDTLNRLSVWYAKRGQYYQSKKLAEKALEFSENQSFPEGQSEALKNLAEAFWELKDYENAILFYERAAPLYAALQDPVSEAFCINAIGASHRRLNRYEEALTFHLKSLTMAEKINDQERISAAVFSIAILYHCMHDYNKALEYYERSLEIDKALGDQMGVALNLNNIGILYVYIDSKNSLKALDCYAQALSIYTDLKYPAGIARMYCNMANIYLVNGDIARAFEFHQKSLRLEESLNNTEGIAYSLANIAEVYRKGGDIDQAVLYKKKALSLSSDLEFKQRVSDSLSKIYAENNHFREALFYSLEARNLKDSLVTLESQKQMQELQTRYETEKKENQIINLKRENLIQSLKATKQRAYMNYVLLALVILALIIFIFTIKYRMRRIRERELERLVSERTTELREEIKVRIQAQEEVRQLADGLEQKVAERTVELETAYSELESFSYSVSHDLRGPARRIEGMCKALLEDYAPLLDGEGRDFITRISDSSVSMNQIIEDLLNLSRITRQELFRDDVDLSKVAAAICKRSMEAHPSRDIDIRIQPDIRVAGDARLLQIALQNLIDNAIKYTGKTVHAIIEFGTLQKDNQQIIFIRDNGVGFDMDHYDKLFAPFQRLHTEEQFSGTGVGLATVNRIIRKHNGRIWAESEPGISTTFYFTIPETVLS